MLVTTWNRWSISSSLDSQSCPIDKTNWTLIARSCEFAGPAKAGDVRRGDIYVGASGLGLPIGGPRGGLYIRMLVGRYFALRRSGHNPLDAQLRCVC